MKLAITNTPKIFAVFIFIAKLQPMRRNLSTETEEGYIHSMFFYSKLQLKMLAVAVKGRAKSIAVAIIACSSTASYS